MRTDPRPDEVRQIVERVFAKWALGREGEEREKGRRGEGETTGGGRNRIKAFFPRIYRPEEADGTRSLPAAFLGDYEPRSLEIDETILIDRGRYVARTYRTPGYMAMWLMSVGLVQFYDEAGRMLATINLFQALRPQRMAG